MTDYVIDENVVLNAIHGKKASNNKSKNADTEKIFLYGFFSNKDKQFMNLKIQQKFFALPKKVEQKYNNEILDNHIIPRFLGVMSDPLKTSIIEGISNNFEGVKKCDTEFVGVTLQSNAILVTADGNLKKAIQEDSFVSKCKCSTVEEVLEK
ncbi:hypothetical protein [Nitrosopumilus sp.]|uniref:hypothetical protein n=1 Tax=Nitrosopumilus sp. TaxID=2024843 RepID=UPI00247DF4DE|nr:hypothetical protein [Nitrosopumilus sp.]MCV0411257.1 hypothetical protein [Nitrosopumilus sp.]